MLVEQLMTKAVQLCCAEDSLEHAAQLMWDHDYGCLPVCSGGAGSLVVGVITDRDICMCALFEGKPLHELRVAQAMANRLITCRPDDTLADTEAIMRRARIRRMPVTDYNDKLVGLISLADLAREAHREQTLPHREITEVEVTQTLAAMCAPPERTLNG